MDPTLTFIVIDNVVNGFSLHRIEDGACIRMYDTKPEKTYPKQVAFVEGAGKVVGGGENGVVYVFDKKSGEQVQTLRHAPTGRVQTVMVSQHPIEQKSLRTNHWVDS